MIDQELEARVRDTAAAILKQWGPMPDDRFAAHMALLANMVSDEVGVPCVVIPTKIGVLAYSVPKPAARPFQRPHATPPRSLPPPREGE